MVYFGENEYVAAHTPLYADIYLEGTISGVILPCLTSLLINLVDNLF